MAEDDSAKISREAAGRKRLILRRERPTPARSPAIQNGVADLLVFHNLRSVPHEFSYQVPDSLASLRPGYLVQVDLRGKLYLALILKRRERLVDEIELKYIQKRISNTPYVDMAGVALVEQIANRAGGDLADLLHLVLPKYSIKADKLIPATTANLNAGASDIGADSNELITRNYLQLPLFGSIWPLLISEVQRALLSANVAIVVPDSRTLRQLILELKLAGIEAADLSSTNRGIGRSLAYLQALNDPAHLPKQIFVGMRSLIALPLPIKMHYFILDEFSEHYFEQKFPTFNVRDAALVRSASQSVTFASQLPSLELVSQIKSGWITTLGQSRSDSEYKVNKDYKFVFSDGRGKWLSSAKRGLAKGPVLFVAPRRGYVTALRCGQCRNLAICECGGRIYKEATGLDCCSRCARKFTDLACSFCHGRRFIAGATGNEWRAEEFGKALPGVVIKVVTGESEERTIDQSSQLIIATVGSAPIAQYQAIILAQGELVFGEISLRAEEQARYAWLRELRQAAPGAEIYIDLAPSHPFSQSIMRGDFRQWQENELTLRRQTGQPPYSRIFVIDSLPAHLASALVARLRQQCSSEIIDSYLPESARLLLQVPIVDASAALAIIKSALNLAYTLNQAAASLRVDPFRPF